MKILDFPKIRQAYNFDCGVSSLQSVLCYYGFDIREDELLKQVKDKSNNNILSNGADINAIANVAKQYGLQSYIKYGLTYKHLIKLIDKDIPVIILLQAYGDKSKYKTGYDSGHFLVCIGYYRNSIIFEDPSSFNRTYLNFKELSDRWHGLSDNNKPIDKSISIIITGTPKYNKNKIKHLR